MDDIAPLIDGPLKIEKQANEQLIQKRAFLAGMDKHGKPYCNSFMKGECCHDVYCPLKHFRFEKAFVCRHWMRGVCRKGDDCEAYHEFDSDKVPTCYFILKYGKCTHKDCQFSHTILDTNQRTCPYYIKGYCTAGPNCKLRHQKKELCILYYHGFCPYGPDCDFGHPKFEIMMDSNPNNKNIVVCHACNEPGHKSTACPLVRIYKEKAMLEGNTELANLPPGKRPLELVTCFKCRERGHYANKCPLSSNDPLRAERLMNMN